MLKRTLAAGLLAMTLGVGGLFMTPASAEAQSWRRWVPNFSGSTNWNSPYYRGNFGYNNYWNDGRYYNDYRYQGYNYPGYTNDWRYYGYTQPNYNDTRFYGSTSYQAQRHWDPYYGRYYYWDPYTGQSYWDY